MLIPAPKTLTAAALDRALRLIAQPRAVLDSSDPSVQSAVFLEAVRRNGRVLDPARVSFTRGAVQANALRKRCAMPKALTPDIGWLALALLQAEAGEAIAAEDLAVRTFAEAIGIRIDAADLTVVVGNEPLPAPGTARRMVVVTPAAEPPRPFNGLALAAEVLIDNMALRFYENSDRAAVRVKTSRSTEMTELAAAATTSSRCARRASRPRL
jgi:hypothetical protein